MQEIVTSIIENIPFEHLIEALAAAGVLSVVLQKFKKWLGVQSAGFVNFLNAVMSFVAVAIQYIMSATAQNPSMLPGKALSLMSLTIMVYHAPYVGIKSLSNVVRDVKELREQKALSAQPQEQVAEPTPEVISAVQEMTGTAEVTPIETTSINIEVAPEQPEPVEPATPEQFAA